MKSLSLMLVAAASVLILSGCTSTDTEMSGSADTIYLNGKINTFN